MGLFGKLTTDGMEEVQDRVGSGSQPLESDIYEATIVAPYVTHSASGAMAVNLIAKIGEREYRETFYVTNREGKNYYLNQNNKKCPLPGFNTINDICLIATEQPLSEQDTEDKVLKLYDFETKSEVNKTVPVISGLMGKKVALGILKRIENKRVKEGDTYVDSAESRTFNAVDKVFHPELHVTVPEAVHGKEAAFWDKWLEANKGKTQDRRKIKDGEAHQARKPAAAPAPKKSLFGR